MKDPRDDRFDPHHRRSVDRENNLTDTQTSGSIWAWSAGLSAVLFIIAIVYGVMTREVQTAFDRNAPRPASAVSTGVPATTGFGDIETTGASSGGGTPSPPPQSGN
jgi:hypothetical protein